MNNGIIFIKIKEEINAYSWGCEFVCTGDPRNPWTLVSHDQWINDDITV
jgi:hypothetical protein